METDPSITRASHLNEPSKETLVTGNVNTSGGDFVSGDKTIYGDEVRGNKITFTEEQAYTVHGLANPYLGLRSFTYDDQGIYAGRELLAQETVRRLTAPGAQQTLLFITGASGSGKSSFAQAALIPRLETHYAAYQKHVRHAVLRPSSQPLVMLRDALQKLHLDLTPETLVANTPKEQINLLLIDQFEELFSQSELTQQALFCDFLTSLPSFEQGRTHVLITLRVDYLDEVFQLPALWTMAKVGVELRAMSADDLRRAVQKPLQVHQPQKHFAPELLDRLVQDVGDDAALLPLLQVTLVELWKSGRLILTHYGSLTDAIRQRAEIVYTYSDHAAATPHQERVQGDCDELMRILIDLINVSPDSDDHRDARQRRTLHELTQDSAQRTQLIEELINARLLAAAGEIRSGETVEVIDIIHESLIKNWKRLRQAIEEQRQQLQRRARFKLALGQWLQQERNAGYLLLTEIQLAEAHSLAEGRDIELQSKAANDFYQRSLEHQETERQRELQRVKELAEAHRRRAQTFRWAAVVATILTLLAIIAAGFAINRQQEATAAQVTAVFNANVAATSEEIANNARAIADANAAQAQQEKERANQQTLLVATRAAEAEMAQASAEQQTALARSRQLAAQSANEFNKNHYELATLLAIEAGRVTDTLEAFAAIRVAITNPWRTQTILQGHTDAVTQATWSKDESKILTVSSDKTVRIWDAASGKVLLTLAGFTDYISQATWSKDESKILTSGKYDTVRIWDAVTGKELLTLTEHVGDIYQATWNKDESKFLTNSSDGTVRIWDAASGKELLTLAGHPQDAYRPVWSKDGSKILSSNSSDGITRIWDAATGKELLTLAAGILEATWSKDESKLLTRSAYGTVRIWDAVTGKELLTLPGQTDKVTHATWSKDESKILTRSIDDTASIWDAIWDAATGKVLLTFTGGILEAMWSKDESKILIRRSDGTASVLDAASGKELLTLAAGILEATWNKDESKILTRSEDGTVSILDAASGRVLATLAEHMDVVTQAMWNKDESKILTSSEDGTARIWYPANGKEFVTLAEHMDAVTQAKWNKDESKILTSNADNTARVWDAASGKVLLTLDEYTSPVYEATWSKDESKILTSNSFGVASIWDAATGKALVKLTNVTATWSKDESKILIRRSDGTVLVLDAASGKELLTLAEHTESAMWSKDASKILTRSEDGTVSILDAASGHELATLEEHMSNFYEAIWSKDGSKILTSSDYNTVRIWDAASGKVLVKLEEHMSNFYEAIWSKDGNKILTSSSDAIVRIWDAATGKVLIKLAGVSAAMWSKDESKILTRSADGTASILDAASGHELVKLIGHTGYVTQATWSKDESKILTSSADGTVRIWDAASGKALVILAGGILEATWSKDESKILTSSADGTVRIWDVHMQDLIGAACDWMPRNMTENEWTLYIEGPYHPTCPTVSIPDSVIKAIQAESKVLIQQGKIISATQRLEQLNGWLKINNQFPTYGVNVSVFIAQVSAPARHATEEVLSSTVTPMSTVTPTPQQLISPLRVQPPSPLMTSTVTPTPTVTSMSS